VRYADADDILIEIDVDAGQCCGGIIIEAIFGP
jgi:hypothetical protein